MFPGANQDNSSRTLRIIKVCTPGCKGKVSPGVFDISVGRVCTHTCFHYSISIRDLQKFGVTSFGQPKSTS